MSDFSDTPQQPVDADQVDAVEDQEVEHDSPEADAPQQPAPWSPDDEEEARLFGWKSPDEWKGERPAGYIDNPQEFLDRVQRSRVFKTMQEKMTDQERKLSKMTDLALERQKREYEAQMRSITDQQRKAVEEADTDAYDRLEKQRQGLRPPQEAVEPEPQIPREIETFRAANEWAQDPDYWHEAKQAVQAGLEDGRLKTSDPNEQLQFAEQAMRKKFPHLFQTTPKPQPRQRVDGGGLATGPSAGRGAFDRLPKDAKDAFANFVKKGVFTDSKADREEYAKDYNNA